MANAKTDTESSFAGKLVVLTGALVTMKRDEAERRLAAAGATLGDSVTKKTNLLIYGDRAGSKLTKAQSLGVPTMTENEMVALLLASPEASSGLEQAKQELAAAAEQKDAALKGLRDTIAAANAKSVEQYGMTVPQLLLLWLRLFSQRPDVYVSNNKLGRPASSATLKRLLGRVPAEWLAVHEILGPVHFSWVFQRHKGTLKDFSEGYNGGRLALQDPEKFSWWPRQDWQVEHYDFEEDAIFDYFVNEGLTKLSYTKPQKRDEATLIFDNANDCERYPIGTPLDYLTRGARSAFTWYWQSGATNEFTEELFESSLPSDTSAEIIEAELVKLGLTSSQASSMRRWLGDSAVMLCYKALDPERARRKALAVTFPEADRASQRSRSYGEVKGLIGAAMTSEELKSMLDAHASFLASGGAGGYWQMLTVSGIPLCIYQGAQGSSGKQFVLRLRSVAKRSLKGADLSFADLSGSCCDDADFSGAKLEGAVAIDASFVKAKFDKAELQRADFSGCELAGASFRDADLSYADFEGADLTGADFHGAKLNGAKFPGVIL